MAAFKHVSDFDTLANEYEQFRSSYSDAAFYESRAESLPFADGAFGLILCAQAFHWFDPRAALAQFGRVLAPGGAVALFWKDDLRSDPFTKAADDLEKEWSGHPPIDMATGLLEGVTPIWRASRFGELQRRVFDVRLPFTVAGGSDIFEIAAKEYLYLARRNGGA